MTKEFLALIVFLLTTALSTSGFFILWRLPNRSIRAISILIVTAAYLVISFFIVEWASSGGWPEGMIVAPVVMVTAPLFALGMILALIIKSFMEWERGRLRTVVMWTCIIIFFFLLGGVIFFHTLRCNWFVNKLNSDDSWERSYAASELGRCGCKKAVPMLIYALDDEDEDVRTSAVFALGTIDDTTAYSEVKRMLKDKSPQVRAAAAYVVVPLGRVNEDKGEEVIDLLIGLLGDEDREVRFAAESGLGVLDENWRNRPGVPADYKKSYE